MTVWYDVSDLTNWPLAHLTGIQRTTVGTLNGLMNQAEHVRLVRFDKSRKAFLPVNIDDLPIGIRQHLTLHSESGAERISATRTTAAPEVPIIPAVRTPRRKFLSRAAIFGTHPAATELRTAFREFKPPAKKLFKKFRRWAVTRFFKSVPTPNFTRGQFGCRTAPRPQTSEQADAGPMQAGDVLLSLGATWSISGHAEMTASLRRHGICVIRMIYDLIPTLKPQWVDEGTVRQVTAWVRNLLTESDHVFTISQFSQREIESFCNESQLRPPPLSTVRLGDELGVAESEPPPLPRFVPQRPFFICVSTIDIRKNHRLLYDAWSVLASRDPESCPDLICLGTPHYYTSDLMREVRLDRKVNGRLQFFHGINDAELAWYYNHCVATIYPSRYEGWGLPVAESLARGKLCLASQATSIPEISRDLPVFFDPLDVHGLVALVDRASKDPEWVHDRENTIRRKFRPTSWNETAGQILHVVGQTKAAAAAKAA